MNTTKHEYLRWNEISRRYVDSEPEFYVPEVWRGRAKDKKQGSSEVEIINLGMLGFHTRTVKGAVKKFEDHCLDLYKDMIEEGVAPEQARSILPQSMMTSWYWSGSLDAFANMVNLRDKDDTQYETRLVAKQISGCLQNAFPVSWKALTDG